MTPTAFVDYEKVVRNKLHK